MNAIKNFLAKKAIGWYVSLGALVCALITVIVYGARGGDHGQFSPVSGAAVAMLVIGIVVNAGVLYKDFKFGAFVPFVFYAVTFAVLMNTEMSFISNIVVGIDQQETFLDAAWVVMLVFLGITIVSSFAAFVMKLEKEDKQTEEKAAA